MARKKRAVSTTIKQNQMCRICANTDTPINKPFSYMCVLNKANSAYTICKSCRTYINTLLVLVKARAECYDNALLACIIDMCMAPNYPFIYKRYRNTILLWWMPFGNVMLHYMIRAAFLTIICKVVVVG